MAYEKTICLDFDGVLNTYYGWKGEDDLFSPRPGVREFLQTLFVDLGYRIAIHSTRPAEKISDWLFKHGLDQWAITVHNRKPPAVMYVDDRGIQFNGDFSAALEAIRNFRCYWESELPVVGAR